MAGHVDADEGIERVLAITEAHVAAVPERILVARTVVHAHDQLEGQRLAAGVGRVHVLDHAAEVVGVVDRRVRAVDGLVGVVRAGIGIRRRAAAGAAVEVDRLHVGVVHRAGAAALRHVEVAVAAARTPGVLAGLGVAARTRADRRGGQSVPLLEHQAGLRIDDHERTPWIAGGAQHEAGRRVVGEEIDDIGHVRHVVVIDVDHLPVGNVLDLHRGDELAEGRRLRGCQGIARADQRRPHRDFRGQAAYRASEQGTQVAARVLGDHDMLAPDRDAAEVLLVAIVLGSIRIGAGGDRAQGGLAIHAEHFRMPFAAGRRRPDSCRSGCVAGSKAARVLLVQVHARCRLRRRSNDSHCQWQ